MCSLQCICSKVLTAYIGLGPSVMAGHSKILVKKMGPSIVISWKKKIRQTKTQFTTHLSFKRHMFQRQFKCSILSGNRVDTSSHSCTQLWVTLLIRLQNSTHQLFHPYKFIFHQMYIKDEMTSKSSSDNQNLKVALCTIVFLIPNFTSHFFFKPATIF